MNKLSYDNLLINFKNYIINTGVNSFLGNLISDPNLCNLVIKNNLYWRNINFIFDYFSVENAMNFLKILRANDVDKKLFSIDANTFIEILKNSECLFEIKKILKDDERLYKLYCDYIIENPNQLVLEMISKGFQKNINELDLDLTHAKIFDMIVLMLQDLFRVENKNYLDIEFISNGEYSCVYGIGSKIFKIGIPREKFNMHNNKRFLKPIYRSEIKGLNGVLGCIEITEKVDTKNVTEEDAQFIYNELRDSGYIWCDCARANLGRLIKKNKVYFDNINPSNKVVNYETECGEQLDAGELVIIDNDYIFTCDEFENLPLDDQDLFMWNVAKYEEKYQEIIKERGVKK